MLNFLSHKGNDSNTGITQDFLSVVRLSVPSIPQLLDRKMFANTTGKKKIVLWEKKLTNRSKAIILSAILIFSYLIRKCFINTIEVL